MKTCNKCGETKPLSEFHKDKHRKDGHTSSCGRCCTKQSSAWYRKNPLVKRNASLIKQYGITLEQFEKMKQDQQHKCAICENTFKNSVDTCVDHDHETKKVRALLCNHCNRAIGLFKESTKSIKAALNYLKKYKEQDA